MRFLIVDDEHELYRNMMGALFTDTKYVVEEVPRTKMPKVLRSLHDLHYSRRLNKYFEFPFKNIWNRYYPLDKYPFQNGETYTVLFMNGSLRHHFTYSYLKNLKRRHPNVQLALLIFDQSGYYGAKRAIKFRAVFDHVFSFDQEDCDRYGFIKFHSCFSPPDGLQKDEKRSSICFFAGNAEGRMPAVIETCRFLQSKLGGCRFILTAVPEECIDARDGIIYNEPISFREEMEYAYNSDCLLEVTRENQTGITLRVCEAIAFNKKLLSNNASLLKSPLYDARYMRVFSSVEDIDLSFVKRSIHVEYEDNSLFSPVRILDKIMEMTYGETDAPHTK